jgi:hypothetical protein
MVANNKQSIVFTVIAGIPIVTLLTWLWTGIGYTRDVERHTTDLIEMKATCNRLDQVNQSQEITITQLKTMFEMTASDIKEIKDGLRQLAYRKDRTAQAGQ